MSEKLTVLVVDDEELIRNLLNSFLEDTYSVILAADGKEAWELVQELDGKVDVLLSDVNMPVMNGVSLLQKMNGKYPNVCVIMMSGTSDVHTAIQAMRQGAYDYISKPFRGLDEINILIQRWIAQQSLEAKLLQYAELHNDILKNLKVRTFLSVDVVGSKTIKSGENPLLIHHTFRAYHRLVESIVLRNGGQIHSTAGDGVMACFILSSAAIDSARQIIDSLKSFNELQNKLENVPNCEFRLRIGIHAGTVVVEESGRVSEMYSESLDLTGHIQKAAGINQIEISETALESIRDKTHFIDLKKDIGGLPIYSVTSQSTGFE